MINNENKKSYAFKPKHSKIKTKHNDSEICKDIMKEKANEIKSIYEQRIKLRKQHLEGYKKFENSNS